MIEQEFRDPTWLEETNPLCCCGHQYSDHKNGEECRETGCVCVSFVEDY
jgi:hypothetical protein